MALADGCDRSNCASGGRSSSEPDEHVSPMLIIDRLRARFTVGALFWTNGDSGIELDMGSQATGTSRLVRVPFVPAAYVVRDDANKVGSTVLAVVGAGAGELPNGSDEMSSGNNRERAIGADSLGFGALGGELPKGSENWGHTASLFDFAVVCVLFTGCVAVESLLPQPGLVKSMGCAAGSPAVDSLLRRFDPARVLKRGRFRDC